MVLPADAARGPYKIDVVADGAVTELRITPKAASTMESAEQEPSRSFFQKIYDAIKWLFQKIFCCSGSSKKDEYSTASVKQRDAVDEVYTASVKQRDEVKEMVDQFVKDPKYNVFIKAEGIEIGFVSRAGNSVAEFFRNALLLHVAEKNLPLSQYRHIEKEVDDLLQFALKHHTPKKYGQNISLQQCRTYIQFGCYSGSNQVLYKGEKKREFSSLNLHNLRELFGLELTFTDDGRVPVMKFELKTGGGVLQAVHSVIKKTD